MLGEAGADLMVSQQRTVLGGGPGATASVFLPARGQCHSPWGTLLGPVLQVDPRQLPGPQHLPLQGTLWLEHLAVVVVSKGTGEGALLTSLGGWLGCDMPQAGQELTPLWVLLRQLVGRPCGSLKLEDLQGGAAGSQVFAQAVLDVWLEGVLLCRLVWRRGGWSESYPSKRRNTRRRQIISPNGTETLVWFGKELAQVPLSP